MLNKPFAITLKPGTSLTNLTGTWRSERPVYLDRLPPCNNACPAGENIQGWLFHAESGDYEQAWRVLTESNPMPAVMGRVCYHPCENSCNRAPVSYTHLDVYKRQPKLQSVSMSAAAMAFCSCRNTSTISRNRVPTCTCCFLMQKLKRW